MTPQQRFAAKTRQLMQESRALTPAAKKKILELLEHARRQIAADLQAVQPGSFREAHLRTLEQDVKRAFEEFRVKGAAAVQQMQEASFRLGSEMVTGPLNSVTADPMQLGRISRSTLSIAQGYTADLIQGLSRDAAAKVNAAIQRSFLGGKQLHQIVEEIGRGLNRGKFDGVFGPIGRRAESIAVNEILRVHSMSAQARLDQAAERHPELRKRWMWTPAARVPRVLHQQASGQIRPVSEPFDVAGEKLMYPRDPNGSAWNTIGCHCLVAPHFDAEALKPTKAQRQLLKDLGIGVQIDAA